MLSGIPDTVEDKDLESTDHQYFQILMSLFGPYDVEACHRIGLSGKKK